MIFPVQQYPKYEFHSVWREMTVHYFYQESHTHPNYQPAPHPVQVWRLGGWWNYGNVKTNKQCLFNLIYMKLECVNCVICWSQSVTGNRFINVADFSGFVELLCCTPLYWSTISITNNPFDGAFWCLEYLIPNFSYVDFVVVTIVLLLSTSVGVGVGGWVCFHVQLRPPTKRPLTSNKQIKYLWQFMVTDKFLYET